MSMNYDPKVGPRPPLVCPPGRTKQSFRKECDINVIIARFQKTGLMDHVRSNPGVFADVSKIPDFAGMVSTIRFAKESFEQLPPGLRKRFHDDPGELISFMADRDNIPEAIKLGLLPPKVEEAVKALDGALVEPVAVPKAKSAEPPKEVSKKA